MKIHLLHQLKAFSFIPHGLDSTRKIVLKLILPRLKLTMAEISINVPFSLYRGILLLSFKRIKETWICNLCKTPFSKRGSEVVGRCTSNTITIRCSLLIRKSQYFLRLDFKRLTIWAILSYKARHASAVVVIHSVCTCSVV